MKKQRVLMGFMGTVLDGGFNAKRWERWRPSVNVHQSEGSDIDVVELFHDDKHEQQALVVRADIHSVNPDAAIHLHEMNIDNPWDFSEVYGKLFDWAQRYPFDTENNEYWVHITTGTHVVQICLFLLVEARVIPGVLLQTSPPKDKRGVSEQDKGRFEVIDLDLARYDDIAARLSLAQTDAQRFLKSGIATRNQRFNHMIAEIEQVAISSPSPILLNGATGAGKSMLAKRIYELKKARHLVSGRFVDVNCATLRGDMAAAALFGHGKGAFTGAANSRAGFLKSADLGVLFLDEIGELGMDEQAMLLKAIEEKEFFAMGSDTPSSSQFQLIAGTHKDLRAEVAAGRFREDLYARINIWQYTLPSLAERREDIEPNIEQQLLWVGQELGRFVRFNQEARQRYLAFALSTEATWRGNFRDLAASITRLATLAQHGRITVELVEAEIGRLQFLWQREGDDSVLATADWSEWVSTWHELDCFDQTQLAQVLKTCQSQPNLAAAGRVLFNQSRLHKASSNDSDRLRKYLNKFDIDIKALFHA